MSAEWIETHPGRWAAKIGPFEACVVVRHPGGEETGYYDGDVYVGEYIDPKNTGSRSSRRIAVNLPVVAKSLRVAQDVVETEAAKLADFVCRVADSVRER